ncbi:MAG: YbaB/EbfC family nucleoid-associated protein [Alphaproteobacteria bacterium]
MTNLAQMMKQAQEMQGKMALLQGRLDEIEVTGQSANGLVQITMTAKGRMRKIKLDPKIVNPGEVEMLEDLILAAAGDAKTNAEAAVAGETEKMMGGLKLPPGVKLPF